MVANKYIKTVDEFMTFIDLIFTRLKSLLSPNNYRSLCEPEAYHNFWHLINGFAKQLSKNESTLEKKVNNVSNEVKSQASNDLPPKSPIIEIRSQTNESEVNTKITNHSKSCSQRKSAESVGRSIEKIISEKLNTEDNEIEKVVSKVKEEDMDWLPKSGTDESDELSIVSKSSK